VKIAVLSDTHDRLDRIALAVERANREECGTVLHAGDIVAPFAVRALGGLNAPLVGVFGNNDGDPDAMRAALRPMDRLFHGPHAFVLSGKRFLLMHEPHLLDDFVSSGHYDFIIYGHVHKSEHRAGNTMVLNPGECCGWVTGRSSMALLDLDAGTASIINLDS